MLYEIAQKFPHKIIYEDQGPFISLYQPTCRYRDGKGQDIIRFKELVQLITESLEQNYPEADIESLMKPFNALLEDRLFWNNTLGGLAILANEEQCIIYRLQFPVRELALVGDQLQIRPLLRYFQSTDRYHILRLDDRQFSLYEGSSFGFEQIEIDHGIPRAIEEFLSSGGRKPYLARGSYGENVPPVLSGYCDYSKDGINKDTKRYFEYVDKYVLDHYSHPMKIPLILAGPTKCCVLFQAITNNPCLVRESIRADYVDLSKGQIRESVQNVIGSRYLQLKNRLIDRYNRKRAKLLASDDLGQVSKAAFENRIELLMIEADKVDFNEPIIDSMINDLAIIVYRNKGGIIILSKDKMPTTTGVAAVYRE